ncbi:hypothetical protein K438DRAFT_1031750 [Mycena galopus ATCC 62051]|nr:hypothetical protein K438DRAFT_1031750 [Mycena galopus ATCC 62051]
MHRLLYARASLEVSCITTSAPTLPPSAQRGYEASFPPRAFDVDLASAWSSVLADNNVEKFETPLDWLHTTFNSGLGIPEHQYSENWLNGGSFCAELNDVYPHELEHSINLEPWLPPAADINMEIMGMWSTLAGGFHVDDSSDTSQYPSTPQFNYVSNHMSGSQFDQFSSSQTVFYHIQNLEEDEKLREEMHLWL